MDPAEFCVARLCGQRRSAPSVMCSWLRKWLRCGALGRARSCDRAPLSQGWSEDGGRRPFPLAVMLRIYSPAAVVQSLRSRRGRSALRHLLDARAFAGLELGRDAIPDETTILNFRHLLERHEDLTKSGIRRCSRNFWEARGALLRGGTIVDATLIAASPSTKNGAQKRDPGCAHRRRATSGTLA